MIMQFEFTMRNKKGDILAQKTGNTFDGELSNRKDYKLPRVYGIQNIDENKELYSNLINHIGKTLRVESNQFNGLFELSLDEDKIVLKEVIS